MTNLGRMLKLYCRVKNIDVRSLAQQLGTAPSTTHRIMSGKNMSQEQMLKVMVWLFEDVKTGKKS